MAKNILQKIVNPSPRGRLWQIFFLVVILAVGSYFIDAGASYNKGADWLAGKTNHYIQLPKAKEIPFHLGLDLQGGTKLVYKADTSKVPMGDEASAAEGVRDVIEKRVNAFGVSEPLVQVNKAGNNDYRVIVELAGVKNVDDAIKMIGETPILEFKEQGTAADLSSEQQTKITETNSKAEKKIEEALGKILSRGDFAKIAAEYDESGSFDANGKWIDSASESEVAAKVKNLRAGGTTDIIETDSGYYIAKFLEKRLAKNELTDEKRMEVRAAHLLICFDGAEGCTSSTTKEQAYAKIKEIAKEATPKNFKSLVKKYSTEPVAKNTSGELGWFGRGAMIKPFEDAVFEQKVGTISYVVETKFGYHLIYKEEERQVEEYKVQEIFVAKMKPADAAGANDNWKTTKLTGKYLKRASVQFDQRTGQPEVSLQFDSEGAKLFEDLTGANIGKPIAIFLDGRIISAPTVNDKISGGEASISGNFNINEAKELSRSLNAGALPVPINLISQQIVGATLGKISVANSLQAGLWGILLVAIFMIVYYRLPGLVSVISLAVYGLLLLAIFKLLPITLTLPGMAGFVLSIGMAVDANVLIFERMKEEIRSGKDINKATEIGFKRAWPSIRDGNLSTIITCLILFWFSTSMVKGFSLTLTIGILVSMFTAITVTRNILSLLPKKMFEKRWLTGVKKIEAEEK